jgi:hypothetical protein
MSEPIEEIRKGLAVLFRDGDVVELRVPRKHGVEFSPNISGFFWNMEALAQAITYVNETYKSTVYVMMNPLKKSWMAVNNKCYVGSKTMADELRSEGKSFEPRMKQSYLWESKKTNWSMRMAEDDDVLKRRWILIDIDAGQPADTNSTDAEHADTLAMAKAVILALQDYGFPAPALTNSGNGHHVYVRVDLENTPASAFLVRRFLKAVSQKLYGLFNKAHVDEGMFNAGRITKAAGTVVYKGAHTEARPQRRSGVIQFASEETTPTALIEQVAAEYVLKEGETMASWSDSGIIMDDAVLKEKLRMLTSFLDFYDIEYTHPTTSNDDIVLPCVCPNAEEHTMNGGDLECVAMVAGDGSMSFCCQHAHCQAFRTWKGMKSEMERRSGKRFVFTDDNDKGTGFLATNKDGTFNFSLQDSLIVERPPSKTREAVKLLKELCTPDCLVSTAYQRAEELSISRQTLQRAYETAGVIPDKRGDAWYLMTNW